MLTPEQRSADKTLCEKASPGPWTWGTSDDTGERIILWGGADEDEPILSHRIYVEPTNGVALHEMNIEDSDAQFIVRARIALREYIAALEAAEAEVRYERERNANNVTMYEAHVTALEAVVELVRYYVMSESEHGRLRTFRALRDALAALDTGKEKGK